MYARTRGGAKWTVPDVSPVGRFIKQQQQQARRPTVLRADAASETGALGGVEGDMEGCLYVWKGSVPLLYL